jgi:outer membrane protein OmpA-like peptidoglycan-associated protein
MSSKFKITTGLMLFFLLLGGCTSKSVKGVSEVNSQPTEEASLLEGPHGTYTDSDDIVALNTQTMGSNPLNLQPQVMKAELVFFEEEILISPQPVEVELQKKSEGELGALAAAYYNTLQKNYYFESNQHHVRKDHRADLKKLANFAIQFPTFRIKINGHADENGERSYNAALAQRRANAVERYIVMMGASNTMDLKSFGEERPDAWGHNKTQWSKNRRVEISIEGLASPTVK